MWQCVKCRERVEDSFDVCWNCGTSRDGTEDPTFEQAKEGITERPAPVVSDRREGQTVASPGPTRSPFCPACGAQAVYCREGVSSGGGEQMYLLRGLGGFLYFAKMDVHVCAACGHIRLFASEDARRHLPES